MVKFGKRGNERANDVLSGGERASPAGARHRAAVRWCWP